MHHGESRLRHKWALRNWDGGCKGKRLSGGLQFMRWFHSRVSGLPFKLAAKKGLHKAFRPHDSKKGAHTMRPLVHGKLLWVRRWHTAR